jgi:YfiH family protein
MRDNWWFVMGGCVARIQIRSKLNTLRVAFSVAADGDQREPALRQAFLRQHGLTTCVVPKQVHGTQVVLASSAPPQLALADGLISTAEHRTLGVFGADCPGLCIDAGDVFAVAHCGWRGVAQGIVAQTVSQLRAISHTPISAWSAVIGPGISGPRYEVDDPVMRGRAWPTHCYAPSKPGHVFLAINQVIAHDLRTLGLEKIINCGVCTANDPRLWSYRHKGAGVVQLLLAWRHGCSSTLSGELPQS